MYQYEHALMINALCDNCSFLATKEPEMCLYLHQNHCKQANKETNNDQDQNRWIEETDKTN